MVINKYRLASLVLVPMFILFSCAPKDQKVSVRDSSGGSSGGGGGSAQGSAVNKAAIAENYKYIVVLMDRMAEAIHFYQVITDASYAQKKGLKVEDVQIDGLSYKKISQQSLLQTEAAQIDSNVSFLAQVKTTDDQKVKSILMTLNGDESSVEKVKNLSPAAGQAADMTLSLKDRVLRYDIQSDGVHVILKNTEKLNKGDQSLVILNTLNFVFQAVAAQDTPAGALAAYKLVQAQMNHDRGETDFSMVAQAKDSHITVVLNEQCDAINGSISLSSATPKFKRDLTYQDSSVVVQESLKKSYSLKSVDCANRPVVDLSRLF